MKLREFGNTGIQVSEIGLGAWQLANPDWQLDDRSEARAIVETALAEGCNFFDTAPGYGGGRSEEILGEVLGAQRDKVVIMTKFGSTRPDGSKNFTVESLRPSLEGSLKRLRTDYVDFLLLHNPPKDLMDGRQAPQYEELERLKAEGKIREYGVSLDWREELETVLNTTGSKAIEVMFNAFYQEPLPAFELARQKGVGLVIKVPLDSGWLSGRYRADSQFSDIRKRWAPEILARRTALLEEFSALIPAGQSMAQVALRFCLAQAGVSSVIPGARSVAQARSNAAASGEALSPELVAAIKALWTPELAAQPLPW